MEIKKFLYTIANMKNLIRGNKSNKVAHNFYIYTYILLEKKLRRPKQVEVFTTFMN